MQKQIWDITKEDIENHPVWVFPMSEDVCSDEATVVPACEDDLNGLNSQVVVQCEAIDSKGTKYIGFMYWAKPVCIEHCQPTIWDGENSIGFWFGVQKPDISDLPKINFPLLVSTRKVGELDSIELEVVGYGYVDGEASAFIS